MARYGGMELQANTRVVVLLPEQEQGSDQRRCAPPLPTMLEP